MTILIASGAFIVSLLSGLGIGGGGLFIVYLALFTDTPQLAAQGLNLLFFLFSAGASLPVHLTKRKIFTGAIGIMIITGALGALFGAYLSSHIDESVLRKMFGALLCISGLISFMKLIKAKKEAQKAKE